MKLRCTSCGGSIHIEGVEANQSQSTAARNIESETIEIDIEFDEVEIVESPRRLPSPPRPPPLPRSRPTLPPMPNTPRSFAPPPFPDDSPFAIPLVRRARRP